MYVKTYQIAHFKYVQLIVCHYTSIKMQTFFLRRNTKYPLQFKSTFIKHLLGGKNYDKHRRSRHRWNQVLKALSPSREEALQQFHVHTALSPSSGGGIDNSSDRKRSQKVQHGSVLTLFPLYPCKFSTPKSGTFFYHFSSQNVRKIRAETVYMED